jgi:hypothetical protein
LARRHQNGTYLPIPCDFSAAEPVKGRTELGHQFSSVLGSMQGNTSVSEKQVDIKRSERIHYRLTFSHFSFRILSPSRVRCSSSFDRRSALPRCGFAFFSRPRFLLILKKSNRIFCLLLGLLILPCHLELIYILGKGIG